MAQPTKKHLIELAKRRGLTLHPSLLKTYPIGTPFYCLHHNNRWPVEFLEEPLAVRLHWILTKKPRGELAVRLKAIRPVKGKLPKTLVKAMKTYGRALADYTKARAAHDRAKATYVGIHHVTTWDAYDKVSGDYGKARSRYDRALNDYHRALADYALTLDGCLSDLLALWDKDYPDHPKWSQETGLKFNQNQHDPD